MSDSLILAESRLLAPAGLAVSDLERAFGRLLGPGIDAGDIYFQHARRESWTVEDGIVKDGAHSIEQGVGLRAIAGDKTGFAYSDEIRPEALIESAAAARAIARSGEAARPHALARGAGHGLYEPLDPIDGMAPADKVEALRRVDRLIRAADPRVQQVVVSMAGGVDTVLVARHDGVLAADVRPLVRFNVQVIVEQDGRRESGYAGGGGRYDYAELFAHDKPGRWAREALRQALLNLEAVDAPAGAMPVVLGPGWPGVLLHEAVGHGLEGDFHRKGTSNYSGRIGQRVAAPGVTIVDDGTLAGRRGSLNLDDEGTPTQCTTLIEDGVLVGLMQDTLNARLMGVAATGNGRRESFAHLPMPRMTNTYMMPGAYAPEEILRSVKKGLYAVNFGGGQVDITSGKYVFSATEAYLIEDGRIGAPVKGATLIGNGPETMNRVRMVGNDLALDEGVGVCGKDGQSVPVGVGQPTLLVESLTVGGTRA
ncbi:metalloprotease TldD [Coralloluteibacterium stylophorae]|uniref:Metalloprotease TldD n=1 Tax=Coralloluteibacterium stylophorae TaxID=1776034 RepID=A0A8J7VU41_9GAMM|nr:metalloprotease TldD [Coralloluteibacterium stylophorae]MBS7456245.1 metalloprotease TldD [Coralloluteibacterium stylophorae]